MNKDSSKHDSDVNEPQTETSTPSPSMEQGTDAKPTSKEVKETNRQNPEKTLEEENQASTQNLEGVDTGATESNSATINDPTRETLINLTPNGYAEEQTTHRMIVRELTWEIPNSEPLILISVW
ncbi:expressed unknown protein [Seminavis robusta]|uniref:Uncharacterized protein n=1 Tax=Seminavis robusta TaxID=568900 RepID=A0A9N8F2F8_9STRA|nr:expressed unknown protein [Seminavis robusta]|eukprot:Sro3017_g342140.1 n/a (124) ;mRNA; r:4896-5340